jgi:hypothetical protein
LKKNERLLEGDGLVKVLVVKATEENSSKLISHMAASSANISAIGAKSDAAFIQKRADYLFKILPSSLRFVIGLDRFPGNWISASLVISFIIGLLSNYLGPSKLIHVVYNPLTILIVWNLMVYIIMLIKSFWRIKVPEIDRRKDKEPADHPEEEKDDSKEKPNWFINWVVGGIYKGMLQLKARFVDEDYRTTILKKIIPAFIDSYKNVAGKTLAYRIKSLMNTSAIGLLLGALVGVYFRGLFFNYNIIWQSTFVTEPDTIVNIINVLFGPAALILDGSFISASDITGLFSTDGTAAAPWIHRMALTTLMYIFIPRSVLAIYYYTRAKRAKPVLDMDDPYFLDRILKDRESLMDIIREGIREIISKKIKKTGETISAFVINDYYEKIIAPTLVSFREKGGKLRDLEDDLFDSQEAFEPILLKYLQEVQEDFRDGVLTEINLFLGRKLDIDITTVSSYQPQSDDIDQRLSNRIAADIGDTIGGTIVTTVALAAGSISGGIGQSLGIAIISGLLGVSGPVGLLIGGLAAAITLGGFYKMKRDKISGMIKDVPLPAMVIKATLSDKKIEKARQDTYTHTENEIRKMLEPKIDEVTDGILRDLTY